MCDCQNCEEPDVADAEVDEGVHWNLCKKHAINAEELGLIVEWRKA